MSRIITALLLASTLIMAGCLGGDTPIPDDFNGDDIYPFVEVNSFELLNQDDITVNSSVYEDKVLIVIFMFTRCPDVCPIVSSNVKWLYSQLSDEEQEQVEVISITVDPWEDDSELLTLYREYMALDWDHFTGELEQLEPVWGNFGVGLKTVSSDEYGANYSNSSDSENTSGRHHPELDYLVDHSTGTILVDKDGFQRVWWGDTEWVPELALQDVKKLVEDS
ncbi:MAG: SCO family protein [Candidatus Thalassarchaeaceae archaeon]|nr:SCO family protein [Candidatus Thalassarchaeaceae archaeon]